MTTYSKETALYDTNAISTDIGEAATTATDYITEISGSGVFVHTTDSSDPTAATAQGVHISDSVDIIRNGVSVAEYGEAARVGAESSGHITIDADSVDLMDGATTLATFGADETHLGVAGDTGSVYLANDKLLMRGFDYGSETLGNINSENIYDAPNEKPDYEASEDSSLVAAVNVDTDAYVANDGTYGGAATMVLSARAMSWLGSSPQKGSSPTGTTVFNPYQNYDESGKAEITLNADLGGSGNNYVIVYAPYIYVADPYNVRSTTDSMLQLGKPTYNSYSGSKSIANSTDVTLGSVTIPAGAWLAVVKVHFDSNSSGRRAYTFTTNSSAACSSTNTDYGTSIPAVSGYHTDSWLPAVVVHNSSETFYLRAWQNSGSSLTVGYRVRLVRLH